MPDPVRILLVEDSERDAELVLAELKRSGLKFESRRVQSEAELREVLLQWRPELVLSDYSMPGFDGQAALAICREMTPETPFIFMSGTIGEDLAVKAMRAGANDYVMKSNLPRLGPAAKRELRAAEFREKHGIGEVALRRAQAMAMLSHVVADSSGAIESWSGDLPLLLGVGADEVPRSGREWLHIVHPEDRALYRKTMIEAGERGERVRVEYRVRRPDGAWVHLLQVMEPLRAAKRPGGKMLWFNTLQDITAQKLIEAELQASEERYRATFEQAVVGVVHTSISGEIVMVNPAFCAMIGYSRAEAVQLNIKDLDHPEDAEASTANRARMLKEKTAPVERELRLRRKDGSEIWVGITTSLIRGGDGSPHHFVSVVHDISERKRAELALHRFSAAMDISIDSIYLVDRETMRFIYVNSTACRRLRYSREELLQKAPHELMNKTAEQVEREYDEVIAAGEKGVSFESRFIRRDRSDGWTELHRRALRIDGRMLIVTIGRDITERKHAEIALAESEQRFRSLSELSSDWFWQTDTEHRFVSTPTRVTQITGLKENAYVGKPRWEVPGLVPTSGDWSEHRRVLERRESFRDLELVQTKPDGTRAYLQVAGEPMYDAGGNFTGYRGTAKDISASKRAEEDLRRFRLAMDSSADIILLVDRASMRHVDCNDTACRLLGYSREELLRLGPHDILPVGRRELERAYDELLAAPQGSTEGSIRSYYRCKDGSQLPFESTQRAIRSGDSWLIVATSRDIREKLAADNALRESEERLRNLALHDALTGLPNRTLFIERLGQAMQEAGGQGIKFALVWFDLVRLTTVNESLGRQAGDLLIKQVAERLLAAAGAANVARIAGDHFAALLPTVKGRSQASRILTGLLRSCFAAPYALEGSELQVAAKAGLALYPNDGVEAETLLRNAEAAHRKAKDTGERYVFFTPGLVERSAETLTLENKLRRALENDEFVLHYQPKVDLDTRKIVGMEGLIRWQSPELGLVPPMKFIPLMEETGLILDAGNWALKRASLDHRKWTEQGLKPPRVAVNVSPIQLRQRDFVSAVEQAILEGVAPTGIDLEITESLVMEDIEGNIGKLREVRKLGAAIAIDDFGTGYSSLAYLAKLPVQTLKIDRSFIITMLNEPDTMTLVQTIISLAHSLRLKVVAEGVDSEDQAKVLRLLRCDEMQGYLFSKPLPFTEMTALLAKA